MNTDITTKIPQRELDNARKLCIQIACEARDNLTPALKNNNHMVTITTSGTICLASGKITRYQIDPTGALLEVCVITPSGGTVWSVDVDWDDEDGKYISPQCKSLAMYAIPA